MGAPVLRGEYKEDEHSAWGGATRDLDEKPSAGALRIHEKKVRQSSVSTLVKTYDRSREMGFSDMGSSAS